ncbi:MAG: hypothetical protein ACI4SL_04955, partial [Candidatus Ornithospirochaeta sp.]
PYILHLERWKLYGCFSVNAKTIRSDFESLVEKGIFTVVQINEKQRGYSLSIDFDEVIST